MSRIGKEVNLVVNTKISNVNLSEKSTNVQVLIVKLENLELYQNM
jgi:hypothetical protein